MGRARKLILFVFCAAFGGGFVRSDNASDVSADELEKLAEENGPLLVDNYIPVTMQILHHCIEMIQYEPVMGAPGVEAAGAKPTTTTRRPTTTTSSSTTTSASSSTNQFEEDATITTAKPAVATLHPTSPHKPGYYGPEKPPPTSATSTTTTTTTTTTTPTTTTESSKVDPNKPTTESLLWSDKPFAQWFLQSKRKTMQKNSPFNVEFLDHLPLKVLQDFNGEPYEPLALRPEDNANEFRRLYDDNYPGPVSVVMLEKAGTKKGGGGKKRIPPTKPYLHMLVLYDLLKREAKKALYHVYSGYSEAILSEMYQMNFPTAKDQLQFALTQLLERKDIEKSDVVSRTKQMIADLDVKSSAIAMALEVVPPLPFGL